MEIARDSEKSITFASVNCVIRWITEKWQENSLGM